MRGNQSMYVDSDKFRKAFLAVGLTKDQLANSLGCSRAQINRLFNKRSCAKDKFRIDFCVRLSQILKTTANDLEFTETANTPKENCANYYAQLVQAWIDHSKMSCYEVSRRSGVEIGALRKIRQGKTGTPRESTLIKLAHAFGASYARFLKGPDYTDPADVKVEEIELPYEELQEDCAVAETEHAKEPINDTDTPSERNMPEWLDGILKEEIQTAHSCFQVTIKAADKKCYASIVCMCAAIYQGIKKDR